MRIQVQAIAGAEPLMCNENVAKRVRACGGRAVFGWAVWHGGSDSLSFTKQNHCVWESPEGVLFDVTPHFTGVEGEFAVIEWADCTEFERDDEAFFDGVTVLARPTKYFPKFDNPRLARACEMMTWSDQKLKAGDLQGCRYWTDKANAELQKSPQTRGHGWDCPASDSWADLIPTFTSIQ